MNSVYTNLAKKRAEQSKEPGNLGSVPHPPEKPIVQEDQVASMGISPASTPPQPQSGKNQHAPENKLATGKSGNTLRLKEGKYEKYSTYLRPGYKKELKLIAADRECTAYDLLDEALTLYLSTLKK
jgi:hypothetical protein